MPVWLTGVVGITDVCRPQQVPTRQLAIVHYWKSSGRAAARAIRSTKRRRPISQPATF
jgi:hypothetical protein